VPLCICPPGFDLSRFIIFDPSTGEWVSGVGCTKSQPSLSQPLCDDPEPENEGPGGSEPSMGYGLTDAEIKIVEASTA